MSRLMGKPTIYIGENKGADELRGNREADQRLCFRYMDTTEFLFYLNRKFQASSSFLCLYRPVCVGPVWKPHCWAGTYVGIESRHCLLHFTQTHKALDLKLGHLGGFCCWGSTFVLWEGRKNEKKKTRLLPYRFMRHKWLNQQVIFEAGFPTEFTCVIAIFIVCWVIIAEKISLSGIRIAKTYKKLAQKVHSSS